MSIKCKKCRRQIPDEATYCLFCGSKQAPLRPQNTKSRGNGQGSVYRLTNGKYRAACTISYYHSDGRVKRKVVTKTFVKKIDAVAALPMLKAMGAKPAIKEIVLRELYEAYIAGKDYNTLSKSQKDKLGYAWNRLNPLEFRGITTLTVDDLQTTIDNAVSTYYPARDMKVMLSHLYDIAIRREIVQYNKTDYIDLPDAPKAKRECWTLDEVNAMWSDYETEVFTGYVLIMCYCGLRYGEVATIQLANIFLDKDYMIGGIKSEAGIDRVIPVSERIKPVIARMMTGRKNKLLEMNEDNFYERYWQMVERTGVRHLPPQTCRHYYFSELTAAGVQGGIIAETGGHASYLTTIKNYVRISLSDKVSAVNLIR